MKKAFFSVVIFVCCLILIFWGVYTFVSATMPPYLDCVGNSNDPEKITGLYLVRESAARDDNLIIFGSSELRTTEISTHPANFFAGKRSGFQVNLVGRGSCQSLIHAISIAASGDALKEKRVVLITSPQSYVPEGIAPDLFMANYSPQQFLELLQADDLTPEVKQYIAARTAELMEKYASLPDASPTDTAMRWLAESQAAPDSRLSAGQMVLAPYYSFSRYLYDVKDKVSAGKLLKPLSDVPAMTAKPALIDWKQEEQAAIREAERVTENNAYGMLDDYYTTNIGSRLERHKDRDAALDYAVSKEYDDLRILFEVCKQKGIEPLFIHVPLHGQWSDYTGFAADRRQKYYENVRTIAREYDIETLDLTGYEYEPYFLCDIMHLGWKGWLEVDKALIKYYNRS